MFWDHDPMGVFYPHKKGITIYPKYVDIRPFNHIYSCFYYYYASNGIKLFKSHQLLSTEIGNDNTFK